MGLLDIINGFRGGATVNPTTTPIVADPGAALGNKTVPSGSTKASDGTVAAIPSTVGNVGEADPLAGYKDLWTPNTTKDASGKEVPITVTKPIMTPTMNIDPGKIMESARQLDFTKGMNPEMLSKAVKGDAEAFISVINTATQNAYAQGAMATAGIIQQAMTLQEQNFNSKVMPDILRRHTITTTVGESALASNPAAAPLLSTIEQQLTSKYPTASPAEIKKHAETYLSGLAVEIVKNNGGTVVGKNDNANTFNPMARQNEDWERYFGVSDSTQAV